MRFRTRLIILTFSTMVILPTGAQTDPRVGGELKQWHKLDISVTGPTSTETGAPNPFSDYNLAVTFTAPSGTVRTVPGYFAADGNAQETSAISGNVWRAHLTPHEIGTWSYTISFKQGTKVAINGGGTPVNAEDGGTGSFTVTASDKTGGDYRGPAFGILDYTGEHALRWRGGGGRYFKIGMNHPEVFLEFADFDNADSAATTTRSYPNHVVNWTTGDPVWQTTKGKGIIGVVNYLASQGVNEHYFLTMNSRGDGKKSFPWITSEAFWNYDVSKLAQWGVVFDHMMRKGVAAQFVLDECENQMIFEALEGTPAGGIADSRRQYYREMAARFGYLNALTWNIGEENGWNKPDTPNGAGLAASTGERKSRAAWLRSQLSPQAHIVVHNGPSDTDAIFTDLVGDAGYSGISYQGDLSNTGHGNGRIGFWHTQSRAAGRRWCIAYDEPFTPGNPTQVNFRKNALWASLAGGAAGVGIYSNSDLSLQDYTIYALHFGDMRRTHHFLTTNAVPFWDMVADNTPVSTGAWCLSKPGLSYVIYLPSGGTTNLTAPAGTYTVHWFDPRNDAALVPSANLVSDGTAKSLGNPPSSTTLDWVALVRATPPPANLPPTISAGPDRSILLPGTASLAGTAMDDGLPSGSSLSVAWTQVSGPGTATIAAPSSAATTASFSDAGTYVLRVTGSDGQLQSSDEVTVIVSLALPTVTVTGFNAVTVNNPSKTNVTLTSLTYNSLVYPSTRFVYGTTERYYQTTSSVIQLWPSGTPIPENLAQQGSVVAKPADVGAFANDNIWAGPGAASPAHVTSLDGVPRLTTIFATPVTEVFVFERGGNDTGTIRAILVGGGFGPTLTLTGNGAPYLNTGIAVSDGSGDQNIFGFILKSDLPIQGIQIDAVGFDATSVLTLPNYSAWALSNAGGQAAGLDFDLDSVPNGVECFMGETGSTITFTPVLVNTAGVLTWTWPYDPLARASFKFQFSGDLVDWTSEVAPPHTSIQITAPVPPASLGSVKLTLPNLDPKRFTRLVVTQTP